MHYQKFPQILGAVFWANMNLLNHQLWPDFKTHIAYAFLTLTVQWSAFHYLTMIVQEEQDCNQTNFEKTLFTLRITENLKEEKMSPPAPKKKIVRLAARVMKIFKRSLVSNRHTFYNTNKACLQLKTAITNPICSNNVHLLLLSNNKPTLC